MNGSAEELTIMLVNRRDRWVDLMLDVGDDFVEATINYEVWLTIAPIVLDYASDDLEAILETIHDGEQVEFPALEDVVSLFWLTVALEGTTALAPVSEIARAWTLLPVEPWVGSDAAEWCSDTVHAQVLSAVRPHQAVLDGEVPSWLLKLVSASERQRISYDEYLYWTCEATALGSTCIAWLGDRCRVLGACLAVSDCAVSFNRVDDRDLALATAAIELLIATLGGLAENTELAEEVGWSATGHDALEMFTTLNRWKKRLEEAAKFHPDDDLSTKELWERIGPKHQSG